jgi:hypothetical protein
MNEVIFRCDFCHKLIELPANTHYDKLQHEGCSGRFHKVDEAKTSKAGSSGWFPAVIIVAVTLGITVALFFGLFKGALPFLGTAVDKDSPVNLYDSIPFEAGTEWVYKIEIPAGQSPETYRYILWPTAMGIVASEVEGAFDPPPGKKSFVINIRAKGPVNSDQHPFNLKEFSGFDAIELEIIKDEIGFFDQAEQVFWAKDPAHFMVVEMATYPPDSELTRFAPAGFTAKYGLGTRPIFFIDAPKTAKSTTDKDRLGFWGGDTRVPHYEGKMLSHFRREVNGTNGHNFTEDMWFELGIGLVRLEQKIGGKTSMTWSLLEFSRGAK